jgi:sugar fermentation stimulation protein A
MVAQGHRAVMVYLIQRSDAETFSIAGDCDPAYAEAFKLATEAGVEALAYCCRLTPEEIAIDKAVRIVR